MENIKIIFLDVDGVLNIMSNSYRTASYENVNTDIEYVLVKRLEWLINRANPDNTRIVVSSSWHMDKLIKVLREYNFIYVDLIIDRTPRRSKNGTVLQDRGAQIKEWLLTNDQVESYVILEDEPGDIYGYIDDDAIVAVDMSIGLCDRSVIKALEILHKDNLNNYLKYCTNGQLTLSVLKKYYDIGFRAQVSILDTTKLDSFEVAMARWDHFSLDIPNRTIVLENRKVAQEYHATNNIPTIVKG